jgi:hypothetical protein
MAWEENGDVLDIVTYILAHELGSEPRRRAFQEFVQAASGTIPPSRPRDIEISLRRDPAIAKGFLNLVRVKEKGDLVNAPSTDDSFYSLARVSKADDSPLTNSDADSNLG